MQTYSALEPDRVWLLLSRWGKRDSPEGQGAPRCHSESGRSSFPGLQGRAPSLGRGLLSPVLLPPTRGSIQGGCGAVRWDQQGPGPIYPDLINRPFISV